MANYLASGEDLTAVASAIRTKGSTSASLVFPTGFVSAIQAIPTGGSPSGTKEISITQNGTTTHDVSGFANAEISVSVSGGGGSLLIDKGTFTPQERTNGDSVVITHNLGVVPQIIIIEAPNYSSEVSSQNSDVIYGIYCDIYASQLPSSKFLLCGYYGSTTAASASFNAMSSTNLGRIAFETALSSSQFCGIYFNNSIKYAADVTYNWIAVAGIPLT